MKFPAEHLEAANMIAVLMGEQHAVELLRFDSAEGESHHDLSRAQSTVDENPAMVGGDERGIPGAAAAEHREGEHCATFTRTRCSSQIETENQGRFSS